VTTTVVHTEVVPLVVIVVIQVVVLVIGLATHRLCLHSHSNGYLPLQSASVVHPTMRGGAIVTKAELLGLGGAFDDFLGGGDGAEDLGGGGGTPDDLGGGAGPEELLGAATQIACKQTCPLAQSESLEQPTLMGDEEAGGARADEGGAGAGAEDGCGTGAKEAGWDPA
jgi:hypothetical protein